MIKDLFSQKQTLSFEVFPPKKDDEFTNAQNVLHQLSELQPDFISVTYGAGGSRSNAQWSWLPSSRTVSTFRQLPI